VRLPYAHPEVDRVYGLYPWERRCWRCEGWGLLRCEDCAEGCLSCAPERIQVCRDCSGVGTIPTEAADAADLALWAAYAETARRNLAALLPAPLEAL
jgi:hypothetical protein